MGQPCGPQLSCCFSAKRLDRLLDSFSPHHQGVNSEHQRPAIAKKSAHKEPVAGVAPERKSRAYTGADKTTRVRTWIDSERAKGTKITLLAPGRWEVDLELSKAQKAAST